MTELQANSDGIWPRLRIARGSFYADLENGTRLQVFVSKDVGVLNVGVAGRGFFSFRNGPFSPEYVEEKLGIQEGDAPYMADLINQINGLPYLIFYGRYEATRLPQGMVEKINQVTGSAFDYVYGKYKNDQSVPEPEQDDQAAKLKEATELLKKFSDNFTPEPAGIKNAEWYGLDALLCEVRDFLKTT